MRGLPLDMEMHLARPRLDGSAIGRRRCAKHGGIFVNSPLFMGAIQTVGGNGQGGGCSSSAGFDEKIEICGYFVGELIWCGNVVNFN